MKNLYDQTTKSGKDLLEKTQKIPLRVWSIVKCPYCPAKYDMRLVNWRNNNPVCPICKQ